VPVYPIAGPIIAAGQKIPIQFPLVSAGFPSPAGDELEDEIDPIAWVVRHPASTFWWRVAYYTTVGWFRGPGHDLQTDSYR
jgi:DNA polymerase V